MNNHHFPMVFLYCSQQMVIFHRKTIDFLCFFLTNGDFSPFSAPRFPRFLRVRHRAPGRWCSVPWPKTAAPCSMPRPSCAGTRCRQWNPVMIMIMYWQRYMYIYILDYIIHVHISYYYSIDYILYIYIYTYICHIYIYRDSTIISWTYTTVIYKMFYESYC